MALTRVKVIGPCLIAGTRDGKKVEASEGELVDLDPELVNIDALVPFHVEVVEPEEKKSAAKK